MSKNDFIEVNNAFISHTVLPKKERHSRAGMPSNVPSYYRSSTGNVTSGTVTKQQGEYAREQFQKELNELIPQVKAAEEWMNKMKDMMNRDKQKYEDAKARYVASFNDYNTAKRRYEMLEKQKENKVKTIARATPNASEGTGRTLAPNIGGGLRKITSGGGGRVW